MNRVPLFLIVFLAVAVLALATFALSPTLMGGAAIDYNNFVIFIELAVIGTVIGFGWLAFGYATPTKAWLVPLGVVAAWCLVVGALTFVANASARGHEETVLREAEERADALRVPNQVDSKGVAYPPEYVRQQLDDVQSEIWRTIERRNYKTMGVYLSLGMLLVGAAAAGKFALLYRQRSRASS
jgi:hypothetical protein